MKKRQLFVSILMASLLLASQAFAAAPTPSNPLRMQPASWANSGFWWDHLIYFADYVKENGDGSIVVNPSQPGAICPVPSQMDMVSKGVTPAMVPPAGYYAGNFPIALVWATPPVVRTGEQMQELMETYEGGKAGKLWSDALEARYNVKVLGHMYGQADAIFFSRVPIRNLQEFKGKKFRMGAGYLAKNAQKFGATCVFTPPQEVYTMLSNKAIDGAVNGSPYDNLQNSMHEVAKYWIRFPATNWAHATTFVINRDTWNNLTPEQKKLLEDALVYSNAKIADTADDLIAQSWKDVADKGVEVIEWPIEDQKQWESELYNTALEASDDPALKEFMEILGRYGKEKNLL